MAWLSAQTQADGDAKSGRAAYLNNVTDLAAKLRTSGMTINDVHAFEVVLRNPAIASSEATSAVIYEDGVGEEHYAFHSDFAMKWRARAAYDVAEAQLGQALMDLRLLSGGNDEALDEVHERWLEYRTALENREMAKYSGGTHASLALALAGLAESERRAEDVRADVEERAAR